ncbi:MAG: MATE family efflux transporter [Bacteroidota bacterium]|nr:MATE family efflux transporter [Bacteroidota bacterium]
MSVSIRTIVKKLISGSDRTAIVKKNILGSLAIKGLSILASLVLVPITIKLLNQEKYGIWMTIFSIVSWFNMMDLGIGNGFRNKFAEALAIGNKLLAKEYMQTFYSAMAVIACCLFVLYSIIHPFLNWRHILNLPSLFDENINLIVWSVFALLFVQLYIKNISTILLSLQKTTTSNLLSLLGNIGALLLIFILQRLRLVSLFSIALAFMIAPILVFLISTVIVFNGQLKEYKPKLVALPKKKYLDDLIVLGLKFFFIQLTTIVLFSSSNILITQLYGPAEVTPYNVAFRLFSSVQVVFTIIVTPFWSAFTEANAQNDYGWIQKAIHKLFTVWGLFSIGIILLWGLSPYLFKIWVGSDICIPIGLSLQFAFFVIISTLSSIYSFYLGGIGKLSMSLYGAIFQFIITIPLAIFLAKGLNFNTTGIIMAINISLLIPILFLALQTSKNIHHNAHGIWNK